MSKLKSHDNKSPDGNDSTDGAEKAGALYTKPEVDNFV
jgi:hypothetical protein